MYVELRVPETYIRDPTAPDRGYAATFRVPGDVDRVNLRGREGVLERPTLGLVLVQLLRRAQDPLGVPQRTLAWHEAHPDTRLRRDACLKLAKALKVKPSDLA